MLHEKLINYLHLLAPILTSFGIVAHFYLDRNSLKPLRKIVDASSCKDTLILTHTIRTCIAVFSCVMARAKSQWTKLSSALFPLNYTDFKTPN